MVFIRCQPSRTEFPPTGGAPFFGRVEKHNTRNTIDGICRAGLRSRAAARRRLAIWILDPASLCSRTGRQQRRSSRIAGQSCIFRERACARTFRLSWPRLPRRLQKPTWQWRASRVILSRHRQRRRAIHGQTIRITTTAALAAASMVAGPLLARNTGRLMIYLDFDGKWLGRFKSWIEGLPDKDFKSATLVEKLGRILLIAIVLAVVFVPVWLLVKS